MRVAIFSDIHGHTTHLSQVHSILSNVDMTLLAGDLTNFGGPAEAEQVVSAFSKYAKGPILAVSGNCDYPSVRLWLEAQGT